LLIASKKDNKGDETKIGESSGYSEDVRLHGAEQKGNNSSQESVTARDMNIPDGGVARSRRFWISSRGGVVEQFLLGLTIAKIIAKNSRGLPSSGTNRSIPATGSIGPLEDESRYYG